MGFLSGFTGILKQIGGFYMHLFGIDKFAKSDEGQAIQDEFNGIMRSVGHGPVFQTKKEKEAAEKRAKDAERRAIAENAENTKKIAELLEDISRRI